MNDLCASSIKCILEKFFQSVGWTLDHFPSSNSVNHHLFNFIFTRELDRGFTDLKVVDLFYNFTSSSFLITPGSDAIGSVMFLFCTSWGFGPKLLGLAQLDWK